LKLRWVLAIVLLAGALYYALFGGDYGYFEVRRLERERTAEEARVKALDAQLKELRSRADSLQHDSGTIERVAREKYGLIRPGERLYRFVDSVKTTPRDSSRGSKESSTSR
jgi:cell division protein FtsB